MNQRQRIREDALPLFVPSTLVEHLGAGDYGAVYRLTDTLAGKVIHPFRYVERTGFSRVTAEEAREQLRQEEEILKAMYDEEISVPKPESLFSIKTTIGGSPITGRSFFSFRRPVLVMEYVAGVKISDLFDDEFRHASELYQEELGKALAKGFSVSDTNLENGIYQAERDRVVIVDMGRWERVKR